MATGNCPTCGRKRENNPGDYYHEKYCEARAISEELRNETDPDRREYLKRKLHYAREVGD
jgi:hypothetical protein